jgi:hypothetical protein
MLAGAGLKEGKVKLASIAAAIAVIAVPIAVQGAEGPSKASRPERRTCEVTVPMGSRLGGIRRCRTKTERDAHKAEARETVDRIQALRPTFCQPMPC